MNIIKKLFSKQVDDSVHSQFIRFGKGEYRGRFLLHLWKSKKVKIKTSFEFANDLVLLCSEFGNCNVSGIVLSKKDISEIMSANNIKGYSETKKGGLFYKNNIELQELKKEQLKALYENSYFVLLDLEGKDFKLKIKKKLPKPGKSEKKIDDKFCQLETDIKHYQTLKQDLCWDLADATKTQIAHVVVINEIVMPKGEEDFAKIREKSLRKGKIIRKISLDGSESVKEFEFEA